MFVLSNLKDKSLTQAFVGSCDGAAMIHRDTLVDIINGVYGNIAKAELFDVRLSNSLKIDRDRFLKYLQEKLSAFSGSSAIVGITHKTLAGHYIVVDEYDGQYYYIRDPYSGSAFKLTAEEFQANLEEDCGISVVHLAQ